ncbi:hypothetical protein TeGR_g13188 [Tetraparma gracilis]|nr:hypothetical protein TeGR_g13188 [Tetraparma gracilis]
MGGDDHPDFGRGADSPVAGGGLFGLVSSPSRSRSDADLPSARGSLLRAFSSSSALSSALDEKAAPLEVPAAHLAAGLFIGGTSALMLSGNSAGAAAAAGGAARNVALGGMVGAGTVYGLHSAFKHY